MTNVAIKMINKGADINEVDIIKRNIIHYAAHYNMVDILKKCFEKG